MNHPRQGALEAYIQLFNAPDAARAAQVVAESIRFEDPFHRIQGRSALLDHLQKSHNTLGGMQFEPLSVDWTDQHCWLRWRFNAQLRGKPWQFEGVSALTFDTEGRVSTHIDYWDSGRHFYAHLPVLGGLIGWVLKRLQGYPRERL